VKRGTAHLAGAAVVVLLAGCANPDTPVANPAVREVPGSPGEPSAPPARPSGSERARKPATSAAQAVAWFARLYVNWDERTLRRRERELAASAVGPARLQMSAAAAAERNSSLRHSHVWNRGRIAALARDRERPGWWVAVTREQTGGSGEYESLPVGFHVTLALAVPVSGGWAVSEWLPQN
jgi:hypothetical protein